jgi:hypothetical protein
MSIVIVFYFHSYFPTLPFPKTIAQQNGLQSNAVVIMHMHARTLEAKSWNKHYRSVTIDLVITTSLKGRNGAEIAMRKYMYYSIKSGEDILPPEKTSQITRSE